MEQFLSKLPLGYLKKILLLILISINFQVFSQNLVKNGFTSNPTTLQNWNTNTTNCPATGTNSWKPYATGQIPGYPTIWEGATFFVPDAITMSSEAILSQTIKGLVPATGNSIKLTLDVTIGEANNIDINNIPIEYLKDNITLEVWFGGIKYAQIETPAGYYSALSGTPDGFGKCFVRYFNNATSNNYGYGESMLSISGVPPIGTAPFLLAQKNSNWDITIP
jgi:hypothetical protein